MKANLPFVLPLVVLIVSGGNSNGPGEGLPAAKLDDRTLEKITVDASQVLNDARRRQIGINTDVEQGRFGEGRRRDAFNDLGSGVCYRVFIAP